MNIKITIQNKRSIISILTIFLIFLINSSRLIAQPLLTAAESSNYKATSRYPEVMNFIKELQHLQNNNIRIETLCVSTEGRNIPLLILGKPAPSSPNELRFTKKTVIYIQANIHAGEVEGKEACLMLARDLLLTEKIAYLDHLVVLIAPIFNADGNEKISTENRTRQVGPDQGVGVRYNGQNLDLNRDGIKLESPEVAGLVKNVLNRWDPALLVDCHTHNGSYHQEPVTYVWNMNPNGDQSIIEYMRDKMIPWIKNNLFTEYNLASTYHGDFIDPKDPQQGWIPAGPEPRYLTNYIGLRNRMAILNENYPYVDFRSRVEGCYNFLCSVVEYCAKNKENINRLIFTADQNTIQRGKNPSANDQFAVEFDRRPLKEKFTLKGYKMEISEREGRSPLVRKTDTKVDYLLPYLADYISKRSVQLPFAYLITTSDSKIIKKLLQHGILVEKLTASINMEVQSFKITNLQPAASLFQGHYMNTIRGEYDTEKKDFPIGTLFIGTAQPLANVAAYLLEPESDDGLLVWNFFDRYIAAQWGRTPQTYPVYKLFSPVNLAKESVGL